MASYNHKSGTLETFLLPDYHQKNIVPDNGIITIENSHFQPFTKSTMLFIEKIWFSNKFVALGVHQNSDSDYNLSIFPNPASVQLIITTPNEKITEIDIVDLTGKSVQKTEYENGKDININTSLLPRGLYLFRVLTNKGLTTRKVLLN